MLVNKESIQPKLLIVLQLAACKNKSVLFQNLLHWRHWSHTVICYSATCREGILAPLVQSQNQFMSPTGDWAQPPSKVCATTFSEISAVLSEVQGGRMRWLMSSLREWNPDNFITFPVEEAHFPWVILRYPKLRKWALCHLNCLSCAA